MFASSLWNSAVMLRHTWRWIISASRSHQFDLRKMKRTLTTRVSSLASQHHWQHAEIISSPRMYCFYWIYALLHCSWWNQICVRPPVRQSQSQYCCFEAVVLPCRFLWRAKRFFWFWQQLTQCADAPFPCLHRGLNHQISDGMWLLGSYALRSTKHCLQTARSLYFFPAGEVTFLLWFWGLRPQPDVRKSLACHMWCFLQLSSLQREDSALEQSFFRSSFGQSANKIDLSYIFIIRLHIFFVMMLGAKNRPPMVARQASWPEVQSRLRVSTLCLWVQAAYISQFCSVADYLRAFLGSMLEMTLTLISGCCDILLGQWCLP